MQPKVWNKQRDKNIPVEAVYVGRPSLMGNPFSHLPSAIAEFAVKDRDEAVDKFEEYARQRIKIDAKYRKSVAALYAKDLVCWCSPLRCHAEILMTLSVEIENENNVQNL